MLMILLMIGVLELLDMKTREKMMIKLRFYTLKILRILNIIINNLSITIMQTIDELIGVVENKSVKILNAEYSDIYKNVTIRINEDITSINYTDNVVSVNTTNTIYLSERQFNFLFVDKLFGNELTLLNDMFFNGHLSIKSICVLLEGATLDIASAIVPTENGTMQYRVSRSFKSGKLDKASMRASLSFIKGI